MNDINLIITALDNIIKINIHDLKLYNIEHILLLDNECILLLIDKLISIFYMNEIYTYKYSYYEPLIELITNIIFLTNIDLSYNNYKILDCISSTFHGEYYLKKIYTQICNIPTNEIFNILYTAAKCGTLPIFLFWLNIYNKMHISEVDFKYFITNSIVNSDDRIFKYLLNIKNIYNITTFYDNNIESIITNICKSNIPYKYKLRRIKLLSQKTDLSKVYNLMIINSSSLKLINMLSKYYYNQELTYQILVDSPLFYNIINYDQLFIFYYMLKTQNEKNIFCLLCNLYNHYHDDLKISGDISSILSNNYKSIFPLLILIFNNLYDSDLNNNLKKIFNYYLQNNYIVKYLDEYTNMFKNKFINNKLFKYTKFYVSKHVNMYNIRINLVLHKLRCLMKKRYKLKHDIFNFVFKPVINEINTCKPNNILKKGSINYQYTLQKFNTIPPRHLLPMENIINHQYLIKEKADGILSIVMPTNTIPYNTEIFNYEIKAEFVEELNLYLVFDINIPETTICERYIYLRSLHHITSNHNSIRRITDFKSFIYEIEQERLLLKTFLDNNDNNIKWYPKAAWDIIMDDDFYNELKMFISDTSIYSNTILNGVFKCDGLILTPLSNNYNNNNRELKIKPKHLQTIDLLYKNNRWVDSNNKCWEISMIPNKKYQNKVYRCYPIMNTTNYIASEIRYDKRKPNTTTIINQILNIYKFDWLSKLVLINKPYYEIKCTNISNELIKIINKQRTQLQLTIKKILPDYNKNWLDLGCGKCKLFNEIKNKYYPKKYVGVDNDINILSKSYYLVDQNNELFDIYPINLGDIWDNYNIWNNFDWGIKYDYIIANFSLMHFSTNLFWEQLNRVTVSGSQFIFNVVKENMNWCYNNSYLISSDNTTKIKFEWTHNVEHIEPIISHSQILSIIEQYGWIIIDELDIVNESLLSCYKWYTISKI
jgi:hypothetical protein